MSVYIRDMEMPNGCDDCFLADCYWACNSRSKHCPLIPVPDHGDLIDAQEVLQKIIQHDFATYSDYEMVFDTIDNAPTIIPAELEVHDCDNCKWFGGLMCDHVDENFKCLGWEAYDDKKRNKKC